VELVLNEHAERRDDVFLEVLVLVVAPDEDDVRRELIQSPSRVNGAGIISVLLDNVGESRLPNYQNLDLKVERPIRVGTTRWIPSAVLFNVFNANTVQAQRGTQNSAIANNIQAVLAPRVLQFGLRVTW